MYDCNYDKLLIAYNDLDGLTLLRCLYPTDSQTPSRRTEKEHNDCWKNTV